MGRTLQKALDEIINKVDNIDVPLSTRSDPTTPQLISGSIVVSGGIFYIIPPRTFEGSYIGNQSIDIIIPDSGKKIQVIGCFVTGSTASFDFKIHFPTSGQVVQEHFVNGTLGAYIPTNIKGNVDENLKLDITESGSTDKWFLVVNYDVVTL